MVNSFGKFCRKLRIDNGELLYDMAKRFNVSSAFLSKVENGKRKPPREWRNIITHDYSLSECQIKELDDCIYEAMNSNSIDISNMQDDDKMMMLSFARKFDEIDKEKLRKLLEGDDDE